MLFEIVLGRFCFLLNDIRPGHSKHAAEVGDGPDEDRQRRQGRVVGPVREEGLAEQETLPARQRYGMKFKLKLQDACFKF